MGGYRSGEGTSLLFRLYMGVMLYSAYILSVIISCHPMSELWYEQQKLYLYVQFRALKFRVLSSFSRVTSE